MGGVGDLAQAENVFLRTCAYVHDIIFFFASCNTLFFGSLVVSAVVNIVPRAFYQASQLVYP